MIRNTAGQICVWRGGLLRATLRTALPHTHKNFATSSAAGERFQLSQSFVETFAAKTPPFGFNGLGELVYRRTYARDLDNGQMEEWYQTVERVVNGTFNMQKEHMLQNGLDYNHSKTQKLAERMYELIFDMKFLPPGRGLWAMGSPITEERKLYAALNNCAFVSTNDQLHDPTLPYTFLMDASMLGVGVGFDTSAAGLVKVYQPGAGCASVDISDQHDVDTFTVPDSREGWVNQHDCCCVLTFSQITNQ